MGSIAGFIGAIELFAKLAIAHTNRQSVIKMKLMDSILYFGQTSSERYSRLGYSDAKLNTCDM